MVHVFNSSKPSVSFTFENMYKQIQMPLPILFVKVQTSLRNNEKKIGQLDDFISC